MTDSTPGHFQLLSSSLPSWVEADPLRGRATDALGLQAVADRLANKLLPGLSVLTTRARYFTFLAWARENSGRAQDERLIHRYEVALAFGEARISAGHAKECSFVGSRDVPKDQKAPIPKDPRSLYKVPAWRAYRASMSALGFLKGAPTFALDSLGEQAAHAFGKAVRYRGAPDTPMPKSACLSTMSDAEKKIMKNALGLSKRGRLDPTATDPQTRRAAFAREVRQVFERNENSLSPESVLFRYEGLKQRKLMESQATLREAAIWERLSLGLNIIFAVWIRGIESGTRLKVEKQLMGALHSQCRTPVLGQVELLNVEAAFSAAVGSLRYAIKLHDKLGSSDPLASDAFELARGIVGGSKHNSSSVQGSVESLREAHVSAKGDDAWIREGSRGEFELARDAGESWETPDRVRLHPYRMSAFGRIASDLGGL